MKKLLRELFYVPKYGKVTEKAMLTRMVYTIVIVIACLAGMSITAYAYFSANITSGNNIIKAANFEADVVINITNENGEPVPVTEKENCIKTADLLAGNTYHIVLDENANSTAKTGFCIITAVGSEKPYHTQQLGADATVEGGRTEKITFELAVTANTTVSFLSHWGTSSHYAAFAESTNGGELYITNANVGDKRVVIEIKLDENKEPTDPTETTPSTTAPTTTPTTAPTEVVYTVQSDDTLWEISGMYGISAADLKEYNALMSNIIVAGDILKIPPADYQAPENTTEQETQETTAPSTAVTQRAETIRSTETEPAAGTTAPKMSAATKQTSSVTIEPTAAETQPTDETVDATVTEETQYGENASQE